MEKCFDEKKIAKLTGTAVQDDETFKAEGGFVPDSQSFGQKWVTVTTVRSHFHRNYCTAWEG